MEKSGRLVMIMIIHVLFIWSLSLWSYSGTSSGLALREFFHFASGTVAAVTQPNYLVILATLSIVLGGIPFTVFAFKRWY